MILNRFQRDGPLKLKVMEGVEASLKQLICRNVEKSSTIYTDDYIPYRLLGEEGYIHQILLQKTGVLPSKLMRINLRE